MSNFIVEQLGLQGVNGEFQGANEARLNEAEQQLGVHFPKDYRDFLRQHGVSLFAQDVVFTPIEPSPWAMEGDECFDIFYGVSDDAGFDLAHINIRLRGDIPQNAIAIGHDSGSNLILLDLETDQIRFFDKDTGKTYLIASNFGAFLKSFHVRKQ